MDPTAAPIDVIICEQQFRAHPLRDIDYETMSKWVRREYMRRLEDTIEGNDGLARIALNTAAAMEWTSEEGLRITTTKEGAYKLASLMCRGQSLPALTEFKADDIVEIYNAYRELHATSDVEESSGGGGDEAPK